MIEVRGHERAGPTARAVAVLVGAVVVGGVTGFGLLELLGVGGMLWGTTQLGDIASAAGALGAGLLAGRLLLPRAEPALLVRVPDGPPLGWPGARLGGAALVGAPVLLVAGEVARAGHPFFFPAQLAAVAAEPGVLLTSYALQTAGLVLLVPALLALAGLIGRERPGWAFWAATAAVLGCAGRILSEGTNLLALHLPGVLGVDGAVRVVADTYGAWSVFGLLPGVGNLAWALLAVGAYLAGVLGWVPALGVSFMLTHYTGVLKGTDLNSLAAVVALAAALVPLGIALWRSAPPVSRAGWWGGVAAVAFVAANLLLAVLTGFTTLG